jgi:hypothetical protein
MQGLLQGRNGAEENMGFFFVTVVAEFIVVMGGVDESIRGFGFIFWVADPLVFHTLPYRFWADLGEEDFAS